MEQHVVLAVGQEVVGQGEGVGVVHVAEHGGQAVGELVHLRHEDAAEERLVVACGDEVEHLRELEPGQVEFARHA